MKLGAPGQISQRGSVSQFGNVVSLYKSQPKDVHHFETHRSERSGLAQSQLKGTFHNLLLDPDVHLAIME